MEVSPNIQNRIFSAADALYQEAGQQAFPTVDAVRKFAKVNMNDASVGMRAWRRSQSTQIVPMTVQVPSTLQQSSAAALVTLWSEAVALANETLRAAQTAWDVERTEAEALREQMASAYETQATEQEATQTEVIRLRAEIERIRVEAKEMQQHRDSAVRETDIAKTAATHAEARIIEIERRADDLRTGLDQAHASLTLATEELKAMRIAHKGEIVDLHANLARERQSVELQAATTRSELAKAREEAAALRGKLDGLAEQKRPAAQRTRSRKKPDGEAVNIAEGVNNMV